MNTLLTLTAVLAFLAPAAQERLAANLIFDAVDSGDPVRVKKVLDADPKLASHKDAQGYTPLHRAAGRHSPEVVKLLLDAGADVNAKASNDDHTPLHRAAYGGSKEVVALLLDRGADA